MGRQVHGNESTDLVIDIIHPQSERIYCSLFYMFITGGNRTMVAAVTIVSMAAADGKRISIFPLVCPNKARCVSFSAPDI